MAQLKSTVITGDLNVTHTISGALIEKSAIEANDALVITDYNDEYYVRKSIIQFNPAYLGNNAAANNTEVLSKAGTWVKINPTILDLSTTLNTWGSTYTGSNTITTIGTLQTGSIAWSHITDAQDLAAIENLTGTGYLNRTGNNTWALSTISLNMTLNGTSTAVSSASIYAPTTAGTSGQVLKSNGSGAPTWANEYRLELVRVAANA